MPIYDYECKSCGKITEIFQRTIKEKTVNCSNCGSTKMEKLFSAPGMVKVADPSTKGVTCCGREERCEMPPCSTGDTCQRD